MKERNKISKKEKEKEENFVIWIQIKIKNRKMQFSAEELAKLSTRTIYRLLLKNIKHYPSKNRFGIMLAIKEGTGLPFVFEF